MHIEVGLDDKLGKGKLVDFLASRHRVDDRSIVIIAVRFASHLRLREDGADDQTQKLLAGTLDFVEFCYVSVRRCISRAVKHTVDTGLLLRLDKRDVATLGSLLQGRLAILIEIRRADLGDATV